MMISRSIRKSGSLPVMFLLTFLLLLPRVASAQETIFDYLKQALTKLVLQSAVMNLANYDYVAGNSLFGVYLSEGQSHTLNMSFDEGVEYIVIAAGDNDIADLDLELRSSTRDEVFLKDEEEDATPILNFTPRSDGQMKLRLVNYSSRQSGFCVMIVLKKTYRNNFSATQLSQALDNVINNSRVAYLFSSRFARGTFCLFGGRLNKDQDTYLYNTSPSPGRYALVGAGSDNISDVDLFVIKQYGAGRTTGTTLASDTETDNRPIVTFNVESNRYYLLKTKNYASQNNSSGFVFAILLEL